MKVEYKVREVTRYVVTRYECSDDGRSACCVSKGEFDNGDVAYQVGYALAKQEHEHLGYPVGDERIKYPETVPAKRPDR